jgi:hypothetical protein
MVDFKKFEEDKIEIRVMLFDKFISKDDFEKITL